MARFLVDEDLPRTLARRLIAAGRDAVDVRDVGLRGKSDDEVFRFACAKDRVLLSADLGFSSVLQYPLGAHAGIVVARFPNEVRASVVVDTLVRVLLSLPDDDLRGNLVIVEPTNVRLRRSPSD